jgi:hypothetical protein
MMKKLLLLSCTLALLNTAQAQQRNCAAMGHMHHTNSNPDVQQARALIEQHTQAYIANPAKHTRAVVNIPVVVHVLYNTATQNISDAQIQSQLAVLNADFRKLNSDVSLVPSAFSSLAADAEFTFCLAQRDPNGAATTGILRKSTTKTVFDASLDDAKNNSTAGSTAWPAGSYLNIWVVPSIKDGSTTGILGYAQFPGGPASTDGVVIGHNYFGTTGTAQAPFNKGRTGTHEVGHWLNLFHIWGDDGTACTGSDAVGDTPNQGGSNFGCPSFPKVSCSNGPNGDMWMNYMDYTDDACMYMFTTGQKARMQALFASGGARISLLTSLGCQAPSTTTCGTPSGLATTGITQSAVSCTWGAVSGASSYTLKYGITGGTQSTVIGITTNSFSLSGLTANTNYTWVVNAVCNGTAGNTASASFTTLANASACTNGNEPTNNTRTGTTTTLSSGVDVKSQIGSSTDVDWYKFANTTAQKNIKIDLSTLPADYDVKLFRSATQVGISQLGGTASEQIKYNNGTVTTYYAQVYGYNGAMSTSSCYTLRMTLSATAWRSSTDEAITIEQNVNPEKINSEIDINAYPNPSNGAVTVDVLNTEASTNAIISVTDVMGRVVYSQPIALNNGVNSTELQLNVTTGVYLLNVTTGSGKYSKQLLIQK